MVLRASWRACNPFLATSWISNPSLDCITKHRPWHDPNHRQARRQQALPRRPTACHFPPRCHLHNQIPQSPDPCRNGPPNRHMHHYISQTHAQPYKVYGRSNAEA
ncbi:hypothetical protein CC80DRAFT_221636 [Byssothecium circinans]|uniref:Uncharacterized protein n=1 Tax=Byssothecium circinans TaxID=147558 RepID=A0A6A5TH28_9PLEO|nr:hypothetical protein CC80DRAFT_221636 [Byssothecium circinans]